MGVKSERVESVGGVKMDKVEERQRLKWRGERVEKECGCGTVEKAEHEEG